MVWHLYQHLSNTTAPNNDRTTSPPLPNLFSHLQIMIGALYRLTLIADESKGQASQTQTLTDNKQLASAWQSQTWHQTGAQKPHAKADPKSLDLSTKSRRA